MENFSKTELENEKWKDIDGYYGAYQVSDLGRVRSLKFGKVRVLRAKKEKNGYLRVALFKHNKEKCFFVHRLVAQAFIPNDDETKTIINHRNSIRDCNRVYNLEWCDYQYNNTYNDIHLRKKNCIFSKIKDLYDHNLSIYENIDLFNEQGIECSYGTVSRLRQYLGLTRPHNIRNELKDLYNPDLSIAENIELFRANGIECSRNTVKRLRKDLGLTKKTIK